MKSVDHLIVFMKLEGHHLPIGELIKTAGEGATIPKHRRSKFRYARSWLARTGKGEFAPELNPSSLPVVPSEYPSDPHQVPLAFYDAAPDGFGRSDLHGSFPHVSFGIMEYLEMVGENGTGALSFGFDPTIGLTIWHPEEPLATLPSDGATVEKLTEAAEALINGEATRNYFMWLLANGSGNVGGARPKARLTNNDGDWIA
jgi:serine/threonine-protein kinase HipA